MNYVATPLRGRLGNNMFQIAATYNYAKDHNLKPIFFFGDNSDASVGNSIFLKNIKIVNKTFVDNFSILDHNYFDYKQLPKPPKDLSVLIVGRMCYFQDRSYLDKEVTLDLFKPDISVLQKYSDLKERTSIHVRRGDYVRIVKNGGGINMPNVKYYHSAIRICDTNKLIIFSDDIAWCKDIFRTYKDVIYSDDPSDQSISAMSFCKNNIISASTFGWWGAYLNQNKNKKVIAPKHWFNLNAWEIKEGFTTASSNLPLKDWIRL